MTNRNGRRSMYVMSFRCCRNDRGVSATTWRTRIRVCNHRSQSDTHVTTQKTEANLEIFDEALKEGHEMLRFSDVSRYRLLEEVFGEY